MAIEMGASFEAGAGAGTDAESDFVAVRIGTRGSPLARWQAEWVADRLRASAPGLRVELVEIKTMGDRDRNSPLSQLGASGTGLFTKEIQQALLDGRVEIAVHSLKDLPTQRPTGLALAAVPVREDSADALIAPRFQRLDALPQGAKVGTGSLRRKAQLLSVRPDLEIVNARGNVETRLRLALDNHLDAVMLAEAGLRRLGLDHHVTERLAPPRFLPAVGQGALGIECRVDDSRTLELLAALDDRAARQSVIAERQALAELEGGCMIPMAAWGRFEKQGLILDCAVFAPDGSEKIVASRAGSLDEPEALGKAVAEELRRLGAERLLRLVRG